MMTSVIPGPSVEYEHVRSVLKSRGIDGAEDFGRFVNRPNLLQPSRFDERAAMPVLLELLPTLTEGNVVAATARHLRRPWAKPTAFVPLVDAFYRWAPRADVDAGWALGDALVAAARPCDIEVLLPLADNSAYGKARQMIVHALWRFRKDQRVVPALTRLAEDADVSLQALSALRRAVGTTAAIPIIRDLSHSSPDEKIRRLASRELRKAERAVRT